MDTALLIGLVIAITQVIKKWGILKKIPTIIVAIIISIIVVAYKAGEIGHQFNFSLLVILITVIIGATGIYKTIKE